MLHHDPAATKQRIHAGFTALAAAGEADVLALVGDLFAPDAVFHAHHPVNRADGPKAIAAAIWEPLARSFAHLRRADDLFTGGSFQGRDWISSTGYLHGVFRAPYLGIPPTGNWIALRFGEFHRLENGRIVQSHLIFDLPDLMRQAGVPCWHKGRGVEGLMPGPASRDGVLLTAQDPEESRRSLDLVDRMIFEGLVTADGRSDASSLIQYWHEDMMWYGPGLIGATMGYDAFYKFHEHPWEDAIAPRGPTPTKEDKHVTRFGDGHYCSFTGWPSIRATVRGDFLGLPNPNAPVDIRVMDFYRRKGDKLIENWIFIDMPHLFLQLGIDLMARMGKGGPSGG